MRWGCSLKYISILRGINVAGKKKIKMADLKTLYENSGFEDVSTYIQSGNVIFTSNETSKSSIKSKLENAITQEYGFYVPIYICTHEKMKNIFENSPFIESGDEENGTKVLVTFLASIPTQVDIDKVMTYIKEPEKLVITKDVVYLYCPNGYGKSNLSNNFLESKLKVVATTRNWKTVKKLCEISSEF